MTITWGAVDDHLRVGIDVTQSPATVGASTTSVTLTVKYYVGNDSLGWGFDDNQVLTLSGSISDSVSFHCVLTSVNDTQLVATKTLVVNTSASADVSRSFTAKISGAYNGATPTETRSHTVDKRPYSLPTAPSTPSAVLANLTATSLLTNWTEPSNWGGNETGDYTLQYDDNSAFSSPTTVAVNNATSYTITGLTSGKQYYVRVAANNGTSGEPYSAAKPFVTKGVPFPPGDVHVDTIAPTTARAVVSILVGPANNTEGNARTGSEVQVSLNSSFSPATTFTSDNSAVPLTGLNPSTTYYVRARWVNALGGSPYVSGGTFKTLAVTTTGFVKVAGVQRAASHFVKVGGVQRKVQRIWVKVGGVYR